MAQAKKKSAKKATAPAKKRAAKPKLLSGDNPQIPKGYGDAPVQAYLDAIPGWKQDIARRVDALIVATVPKVQKALKWNTPLYGLEEDHFFVGYHCFKNYLKVTFFHGASLKPVPPGQSKHENVRYLDIREGELDERQFSAWIKQAAKLPGEKM